MGLFYNYIKLDAGRFYIFSAAVFFLGALILYFIFTRVFKSISKKFISGDLKETERIIKSPAFLFSAVITIKLIVEFNNLLKNSVFLDRVLTIGMIISTTWLVMRVLRAFKQIILLKIDNIIDENEKKLKTRTQFDLLEKIVAFFVYIVAIFLVLISFESIRKFGLSILASAGLAGIIVGLAAQKMIATVISGIQIAVAQPIRIHDTVIVENESGTVEEINLTNVVIKTWDLRRLVLPTTYFMDKPFQNWTKNSPDLLATVFIYADYTIPVGKVREECMRLLESSEFWDGSVGSLHVTGATEKTIELRVTCSAEDAPSAWELRTFLREKLIEYIRENFPESLPRERVIINDFK